MASPGVRARILITVSAALLISILLLSYPARALYRVQLMNTYRQHQQSLLKIVQNAVSSAMVQNRRDVIQLTIDQLRAGTEIQSVRIINPAGAICYSTTPDEAGNEYADSILALMRNGLRDHVLSEKKAGGIHQLISMVRIPNRPLCYPCHGQENLSLGYLAIESDLGAVDRAVNRSLDNSLYVILVSLLLAGAAIAYIHIRFIKSGLRKVLSAVKEIERGNFRTCIDIRTKDEFGLLAASFNTMIQRLNQMQNELEQAHRFQLERADRMASVGEIAAGIAHEIKNPVTGISSSIRVMLEEIDEDDERLPIFKEIIRQTQRIDDAINNLLTFARPKEPYLCTLDLSGVLTSSMKLVREQAKQFRVDVEILEEEGLPGINADAEQIEQVLVNLLMNGIQAMPGGGSLRVSLAHDPAKNVVRVRISDTGVGISPEQMKNIFRPFYTTKHRGTGLGLTITHGIIRRHGGEIEVESTVGSGTTVTVVLPAIRR